MKKAKLTAGAAATFLIAGTTAFQAFASTGVIPTGTVVLGGKAYSLDYANNPSNLDEIHAAIIASNNQVFVKDFNGNWVDNNSGNKVDASVIPAVTYKATDGTTVNYGAGDTPYVNNQTLAVSSVSALNVKQVQVTFNNAVDKTTAETVTNYQLNSTPLASSSDVAKLQADGKTVVITLNTPLTNQTSNALTVSGVKDTSANAITAQTVNFTVVDNAIPQALSATLVSPAQVKVKFSAPVQSVSPLEYSIDNGQYSIVSVTADPTDDSALLTLSTALPAGNHSLVVSPVSGYAPQAYNHYSVPTTTLGLNSVVDTTAPTATITSVALASSTSSKVQVKFNKPVALNGAEFYWTYNKVAANIGTATADSSATSYVIGGVTYADTYDVTFNNVIPAGTNTFYIDNDADVTGSTNYIVDTWGNKFQSTSLAGTLTTDTTKPTVTKVALNGQSKIDVTFSKDVSNATTGTNYVLKDSTGALVTPSNSSVAVDYSGHPTGTISNLVSSNGYYEINLGANLKPGVYTLVISGVQDNVYPAHNTMDSQTYTLTVTDTAAPSVSKVTKNTAGTKLFVYYNKPMAVSGAGSILDTTNYQLNGAALPAGTTIAAANGNSVAVISFPSAQSTLTNLAVGAVRDSLGNVISGLASPTNSIGADSITESDIVSGSAVATANNTISFQVDQPLSGVTAQDILVNGAPAASATFTNQTVSSGVYGALVTIKAATAFTSTATTGYSVTLNPGALTNVNASPLTFTSGATTYTISTISDSVAPLISAASVTDTSTSSPINATTSDNKNLVVDLSTVTNTSDKLNTISVTAEESATISLPIFTVNGTTIPAQSVSTNGSGVATITLASLTGITDVGSDGVSEASLKKLAGASDTITVPMTIIDKAGNTTTGSITIKGLH